MYQCIYYKKSHLDTVKSIKKLLSYKNAFVNEDLMKSVIVSTIRDLCNKNNEYTIYKQLHENFH